MISSSVKFVAVSLRVNVRDKDVLSDTDELLTSDEVITTDGPVPSYVQTNCVAAVFRLPLASVKAPASTSI